MASTPPLNDVLEDICVRFIVNCPPEEHETFERLFFQIEQAHWFYEDYYRERYPKLPACSLREFSKKIFNVCPPLQQHRSALERLFESFREYKSKVPVCGGILLNKSMTKCVLVKGWSKSSSWSFPRGKINQDEPEVLCAIREIDEEIGFDVSDLIVDSDYLKITVREQNVQLFIVVGVDENSVFQPKTKKEISKIEWFPVSDLPSTYHQAKERTGGKYFFMVLPFVNKLRQWIKKRRQQTRTKRGRGKSVKSGSQASTSTPVQILSRDDTSEDAAASSEGSRMISLSVDELFQRAAQSPIRSLAISGSLQAPSSVGGGASPATSPSMTPISILQRPPPSPLKHSDPVAQRTCDSIIPRDSLPPHPWRTFSFDMQRVMAPFNNL